MEKFTHVKVFSVTKAGERHALGDEITNWIAAQRTTFEVVDREVLLSSDTSFHCYTMVLFYRARAVDAPAASG